MVVLATLLWMWCLTIKARTPLSVAVIGLGLFSLIRLDWAPFSIKLWKGAPQRVLELIKTPAYSLPSLLFVGYLLAVFANDLTGFWSTRLQLSMQALGIPGAFFVLSAIYIRYRAHLYMAFGLFATVAAIAVGTYLFNNNEAIIVCLGQGRVVPTPTGHVRFAMTLAVTAIAMWWYAGIGFSKKHCAAQPEDWLGIPRRWLRRFATVFAVVLTIVLHFVAIRTGVFMFYIGLLILVARILLPRVGWKGVGISLLLCSLLAGVAVTKIPTLSRKLDYASFDLGQMEKKGRAEYSDVGRIASIIAGIEVIRTYPLTGAPNGDVAEAMDLAYAKTGNANINHPPHNQFIYSWVAAGFLGFLGVCAVLIGPLLDRRFWRKPLLAEGWAMIAAMFFVEAPLESDIGIGLCMLALYLPKIGEGLLASKLNPQAFNEISTASYSPDEASTDFRQSTEDQLA